MTVPAALSAAPAHLRELLVLASEAALAAGRLHHRSRSRALKVETKSSPTDLVSQVDREAEELIVARLLGARPHDALLAEEGGAEHGSSGVRWLVDPLDGTTNFVYGYPGTAVSIAAEVDGRPAVGVVFDSTAGRLYQAVAGVAATCDGEPLQVRRPASLATALAATGFGYSPALRRRQAETFARLADRIRDIRRGGSAALDLCHLAAGRVDLFWERGLAPWDHAAGAVIAGAAGADVRLLPPAPDGGGDDGRPAVVAAHPDLLPALVALLVEAGAVSPPGRPAAGDGGPLGLT